MVGKDIWEGQLEGKVAYIKTLETIKKKVYVRMRTRYTCPETIE